MKIDNRIDYRAQTADHFTTYTQPDDIRKIIDRNRNLFADIAANASRAIASQGRADSRRHIAGGTIDRFA